jgi:hypothetical protein
MILYRNYAECSYLPGVGCNPSSCDFHCIYRVAASWNRVLDKVIVACIVMKFVAIYGRRRFSSMFTKFLPLDSILSQTTPVHILRPCFFKVPFTVILSSVLGVPYSRFPLDFSTKLLLWPLTIAERSEA